MHTRSPKSTLALFVASTLLGISMQVCAQEAAPKDGAPKESVPTETGLKKAAPKEAVPTSTTELGAKRLPKARRHALALHVDSFDFIAKGFSVWLNYSYQTRVSPFY